MDADFITLAHGGGGKAQNELIEKEIVTRFAAPELAALPDGAITPEGVVVSTDSFVVTPRFFPGGSVGKLAVAGSVNDVLMAGGVPKYLTCALILEEGLPVAELRRILDDMAEMAKSCGVAIVTGDTKVVPRGSCDGLYVNTAGVGFRDKALDLGRQRFQVGDKILVSGSIGEHGMAIMAVRHELESPLQSDCASLQSAVAALKSVDAGAVKFLRDATRGGVFGVTDEIFRPSPFGAKLEEAALPVRRETRAIADLLGLDPGFAACEGRLVAVVAADVAEDCVAALRGVPGGEMAGVIGTVTADAGAVHLVSEWGRERRLIVPAGGELPRIC